MNRATSFTRTGLLAVLMAMVGFSYALATSNSSNFSSGETASNDLAERAASGVYNKPGGNIPLSFANPFCTEGSTDRDLGDATFGSALTRLVRAKGGVAPYKFTSDAGTELAGLKLLLNGILTGTPTGTAPTIGSTQVRFNVTVFDSFGSNAKKTEKFRLTYFATSQFRFAHDKLSDGVQFTSFSDSLYVINGVGAKFTTTGTALSDLGLNLSSDGAVYGTPLKAGTFTFVATATKGGNTAAGRNGSGNSQTITIKITGSKSLQSLISATSITIKSGNGSDKKGVGRDSIQYKGVANVPLASLSDLSGDVSIRVGTYSSPSGVTFSGKGKATSAKGVIPAVKASVSSSGGISIGVSKDTIVTGAASGSTAKLAVEVRLGNATVASELLTFAIKSGKNGAVTLTYKASASSDLSGSFLLTSVQGADDKGATGDAWKASFVGRTPGADATFKPDTSSVDVSIGSGFASFITLGGKGTKVSGKGDKKGPNIATFSLDSKSGKGAFSTGVLPSSSTGIVSASKQPSGVGNAFSVNMTFGQTGFSFDGALAISASKNKWSSKLSAK